MPFLYCPLCDCKYSASSGDYFLMRKDKPFTCGECGDQLILAREMRVIDVLIHEPVTVQTLKEFEHAETATGRR